MKNYYSIFLFGIILIGSKAECETIDSVSRYIERPSEYIIKLGGRWTTPNTSEKPYPIIPSQNSTRITCDFKAMNCEEARASIITPKEFPNFKAQRLFPQRKDYKIIEISEKLIRAEHVGRAATFTLTLNSVTNETCLIYTQKIKDKDGTIPAPQNWCLR